MKTHTLPRLALALVALLGPWTASAATQQNQASSAIVLQGFHWNSSGYANPNWDNRLYGQAADIAAMGFTHVWIAPPQDSSATQGYLPRQLNVLNSAYGSEADLKNALTAFNNRGVKAIADIVINHRVGTTNWADFTNPTWGTWSIAAGDECNCSSGAADSGTSYSAARDLDHSNLTVQNDIKTWLNSRLKSAGFTGLRFDYSKGYGASYAKVYHDAFAPDFCVGEIWTDLDYNNVDAHRQQLMSYIDGTGGACAAFDFTTKGLLNRALQYGEYYRLRDSTGKPGGAIGWWATPARARAARWARTTGRCRATR
jgi:alpha-amylase